MHRASLRPLLLAALGAGLSVGCVRPGPLPPAASAQPPTVVAASAPGRAPELVEVETDPAARDEVEFYDLMNAYGLDTSIDLVTGQRVCRDGQNTVVVMPSSRELAINGLAYPLTSMIRWRDGVLYLPGECRALLAEHLEVGRIREVAVDPRLFDGSEHHLAAWQKREGGAAPSASAAAEPKRSALPAGWVVAGRRWKYIVIHHSATEQGGAASFHREHSKKWQNGLGYHFVIGNGTSTKDGEIEIGPRWKRQNQGIHGAHAGNALYNKLGIGVCLVGDFNDGRPTAQQLASLRQLCRALMRRYGIPSSRVVAHKAVRKGSTDCPGEHFSIEQFRKSL